jgi:MFS family permease
MAELAAVSENEGESGGLGAARLRIFGLNIGHACTHFFLLIYPTAVLTLQAEGGGTYGDLLLPATVGFLAYATGAYPSGWLGDRWSRRGMMVLLFFGLAAGALATGLAQTPWQLAAGLGLIGLSASIYHPVGLALLVEQAKPLGRTLGVNGVWGNMGVAAAPLATALLAEGFGWRWAFFVPAGVALLIGLAWISLPAPADQEETQVKGGAGSQAVASGDRNRVFLYIVAAVLFSSLVFDGTTITLPKLIDEQVLSGPAALGWSGTVGAGGLASLVFALAAFAQILVGHLIDRLPIKPIAFLEPLLQAPCLLLAAWLAGWLAFPPILLTLFLVFGQLPIKDALVARYSSRAMRARIYAVKYLLTAGVGAATVPVIAWLHVEEASEPGEPGAFLTLYALFALLSALTAVSAFILPPERKIPAQAAAR